MLRPEFCGKWMVLEALLREWKREGSNKVLIFTKSVKLLEMLEFHLNTRGLCNRLRVRSAWLAHKRSKGHGFLKLDGSTKQADRKHACSLVRRCR